MFTYTAEREIQAPADVVFAYLADVSRQPEWVQGVTQCHWLGGGPGLGSTASQTMTTMGRTRTVTLEVVDYEEGRRIAFEKHEPMRVRFGFELTDRGEKTLVRYPVEIEPHGVAAVAIRFVGPRVIGGDLTRIAAALEHSSRPDGV